MPKITTLFLLMLLCASATAQPEPELDILFVSQPGEVPASIVFHDVWERPLDANGDGTPDLIMVRTTPQGHLDALRAVNAATNEVLFEIQAVQTTLSPSGKDVFVFHGFVDLDGDEARDAVFASDQEVVVGRVDADDLDIWQRGFNPNGGTLDLTGLADLTGDGTHEMIIFYPDEDVVRIWINQGEIPSTLSRLQ